MAKQHKSSSCFPEGEALYGKVKAWLKLPDSAGEVTCPFRLLLNEELT